MLFGGGSKKNKLQILWENPAPNSNFGAQTIACDFSKVDFEKTEIILKFKRKATDTKTIEIRLNEGENEVCVGNSSYFYWRKYTLSKTGVVIASGGYTSTYPEIKADNSCAIPIELKKSGGGVLVRTSNYLKTLLLSLISHFQLTRKPARKEVSDMLFGGNKSSKKSGGIEKYQRFRGNYAKDFFARYKDQPGWETNLPDSYFNMKQNVNFNNGSSISDPAKYPWYIKFPKPLVVLECYTYCNNWAGITEMAFVYEDGTIEACTGPKTYSRYNGGGQSNRTQLKECVGVRLHFYGQGVGYAPDAHYQGGGVIDWLEKVGE